MLRLKHFFSNQLQQKGFTLNAHALLWAFRHCFFIMSNRCMNVHPNRFHAIFYFIIFILNKMADFKLSAQLTGHEADVGVFHITPTGTPN